MREIQKMKQGEGNRWPGHFFSMGRETERERERDREGKRKREIILSSSSDGFLFDFVIGIYIEGHVHNDANLVQIMQCNLYRYLYK